MTAPVTHTAGKADRAVLAEHSHGVSAIPTSRAQQLSSRNVEDFPVITGREEEWRFTPIRRLRGLVTGGFTAAEGAAGFEHGELPSGVTVQRVSRDAAQFGEVLTPFDRASAQAMTSVAEVVTVSVGPGVVVTEPVHLTFAGADAQQGASFGHTVIEARESSQVTVILDHVGSATLADNVELWVADNARLRLVSIADWDRDAVQLQHQKARLGRDASLTHIAVTLGGDVVRQYTSVEFAGPGAEVDGYGIYFADAGQHMEHRLLVDHRVPDCRSNVAYRGALQGQDAHTVWVGDVLIRPKATGTETYEINRNLVLSDGARADSVPNLEIETGEIVSAGHASATGRFDDEQLFYLQSRGISEAEARRLVVRGFFAELVSKIGLESVQQRLLGAIEARLASQGV
ncbi:MAG: Fe-S cluster assembly protein SufD [Mycobacteriales bacterium]